MHFCLNYSIFLQNQFRIIIFSGDVKVKLYRLLPNLFRICFSNIYDVFILFFCNLLFMILQKRHRNAYTGATPKYSAQFLPDQKPVSPDDNRASKEESQNSKSVSRQETFSEKDGEWKKPEKRRSILKKKSESLKRGLAAVNNANSTWWNKRYTNDYGNDSPRLPTAYLRDLKVHRCGILS